MSMMRAKETLKPRNAFLEVEFVKKERAGFQDLPNQVALRQVRSSFNLTNGIAVNPGNVPMRNRKSYRIYS
jgi:hypothetical protein